MTQVAEPCANKVPAKPEPLGVGFGCHLTLPDALYASDVVDFVEITPEIFHREENVGGVVQLVPERRTFDVARRRCGDLPVTMHGVSLSIGSAHGMYEPSLAMMDRLRQEWPFRWYSEHLQFQIILDADGAAVNTGTPFPLPPTKEAAELVAARAASIQDRYGVPFLLENPVHYLPDLPADAEVGDEFGLMERIVALSGCGQLLDLHNLYCNAINFGFDAIAALDRIRLDRVGEIHVAGGSWREDTIQTPTMDAYRSRCGAFWKKHWHVRRGSRRWFSKCSTNISIGSARTTSPPSFCRPAPFGDAIKQSLQ